MCSPPKLILGAAFGRLPMCSILFGLVLSGLFILRQRVVLCLYVLYGSTGEPLHMP